MTTIARYIRFAETAGKNGVDIYITDSPSEPLEFKDKKQTLNAPVEKFNNKENFYQWVKTNRVFPYLRNLYDKLSKIEKPMFYYVVKIPDKKLLSKYEPIFRMIVPFSYPGHPKSTWAPTNKHIEKNFKEYFRGLIRIDFGNQDFSVNSRETRITPIDDDKFIIPVKSKNIAGQNRPETSKDNVDNSLIQFSIEPETWFKAIVRTNLFRSGEFLRKYSPQEGGHRFQMSRSDFEKFKNKVTDPNFIRQVQQVLRGPNASPQDKQIPIIPKIVELNPEKGIIENIDDISHDNEGFNLNIMPSKNVKEDASYFGNGGSDDDDDDDSDKIVGPMHFEGAVEFFSLFEGDTFDKEVRTQNGWEGYVMVEDEEDEELQKAAGFIFDDPSRQGDDDPGIGWYMRWLSIMDDFLEESREKNELKRILKLSGLKK